VANKLSAIPLTDETSDETSESRSAPLVPGARVGNLLLLKTILLASNRQWDESYPVYRASDLRSMHG